MAKLLRTRVRRGRNPIFKCRTTIFYFYKSPYKRYFKYLLRHIICDAFATCTASNWSAYRIRLGAARRCEGLKIPLQNLNRISHLQYAVLARKGIHTKMYAAIADAVGGEGRKWLVRRMF